MPGSPTYPDTGWAPTIGRSIRLFREFLGEQSDPVRFYDVLARDSVGLVAEHIDVDGARTLDVGGGPGHFHAAFTAAGAAYHCLDIDHAELAASSLPSSRSVVGDGRRLPFADDAFDLVFSSNALEHVAEPWRMADEMVRVARPGGIVFLAYTAWYGLWGGHETAPWHYLGGEWARARYRRRHGREPKNRYGESLFRVTVADGLRWAREQQEADVVAAIPRYHPRWAYWVVRVPGVREVVTWNLALTLRKR